MRIIKIIKLSITIFLVSIVTIFCTVHIHANEANYDPIAEELSLEALYNLPIIDIATGYAVPLEKAPSVATVITAEDIIAMGL